MGKENHLLEGSLLQHTQVLPGLPWLQPAGSPRPSTSEISMKDLACDGLKPSPVLDGDEQMLGSSSACLRFCTSTQLLSPSRAVWGLQENLKSLGQS